jgi:hypothetical protein
LDDYLERYALNIALVDKIRRTVPPDFSTTPCFGGPIHPTARMLSVGIGPLRLLLVFVAVAGILPFTVFMSLPFSNRVSPNAPTHH